MSRWTTSSEEEAGPRVATIFVHFRAVASRQPVSDRVSDCPNPDQALSDVIRERPVSPHMAATRYCSLAGAIDGAMHAAIPTATGLECLSAKEDGGWAKLLLDAQELVVLRDAVAARGTAGLDLADVGCDGQVGDGGILGFARSM